MKKPLRSVVFLVALAILAAAPAALASGSYCACLPKPPGKRMVERSKVDRDKYDTGQKVFNGRMMPATGEVATQLPRLKAMQSRLPEKVARKRNLLPLAGNVSDSHLDALEYYLNERYPASK